MGGVTPGLRALLGRLVARKGVKWSEYQDPGELVEAPLDEADVTTSLLKPHEWNGMEARHLLVLDVDYPVYVVESSTPGHSHVYFDVPGGLSTEHLNEVLDVLAATDVVEPGYAAASKGRGYTALRLPWVRKATPPAPAAMPSIPLDDATGKPIF